MVNKAYKSSIIRKYGTNVELHKYTKDVLTEVLKVKAVLGRNTRNNVNMFKLSHQREGIFLPETPVDTGDYVYNKNHSECYLIVGRHQEYDMDSTLSIVTGMMICEHSLTIKGIKKVADARGNIKNEPYEKYKNIPCYLEFVGSNLRQHEPGLNPETEYKLYVTDIELLENETVNLKGRMFDNNYKILTIDYVTFPGLAVLEIKRDVVTK